MDGIAPMATQSLPKAVFLDVDGVLHPFSATSFFHAPCMRALRTIIENVDPRIVSEALGGANETVKTAIRKSVGEKSEPASLTVTPSGFLKLNNRNTQPAPKHPKPKGLVPMYMDMF